jgi:hypothetical protein
MVGGMTAGDGGGSLVTLGGGVCVCELDLQSG